MMRRIFESKLRVSLLAILSVTCFAEVGHTQTKVAVPDSQTWFNADREAPIWFANDAIAIIDMPLSGLAEATSSAVTESMIPGGTVIQTGDSAVVVSLPAGIDAAPLLISSEITTRSENRFAAVYRSSPDVESSLMIMSGELVVFAAAGTSQAELRNIVLKDQNLSFSRTLIEGKAYLYNCTANQSCLAAANELYSKPEVKFAYPNWIQFRETRSRGTGPAVRPNTGTRFTVTDPLFADQWHLNNTAQGGGSAGEDANVQGAYNLNISGIDQAGFPIVVGVVDDGLELTHEDLNLFPGPHIDLRDNDADPTPGPFDFHGTAVAGVAAADGFNGLGGSGAAPSAQLAGIRLIGGGATDVEEAMALNHELTASNYVDIYNNSWGPADNSNLHGLGPLVEGALEIGVVTGRSGWNAAGAIYVWAGGNGLQNDDNSNYDAYANSRYTIAVGASTDTGVQSFYSEPGANLLVNAPSSGGSSGITTTDITGVDGYNSSSYTNTFGGTSSASPLVAGVVALMLDSNSELQWRDVQKVLATSAEKNDPTDSDWTQNSAGHWINHKYGFGRVDATAAVNAAAGWVETGPEITASTTVSPNTPIPDNTGVAASVNLPISDVIRVQHVELTIDTDHTYWGDLEIVLTSPSGTQSVLTETHGSSGAQLNGGFTFTSMRHLDELSNGTWTLSVTDNFGTDSGDIDTVTLGLFGDLPPVATCNGLAITVNLNLGDTPGPGNDVILGTPGNDDIRGRNGDDTICGMGGDDFLHGNSGDDWIDGGDGIDNIKGGQGDDVLFSGAGATVGTSSRVFGGNGIDVITGGPDADDLRGGRDSDTITGLGGADSIFGNNGNDDLSGGAGADTLNGGQGNDDLFGDGGSDTLNGGSGGNDFCDGGGQSGDSFTKCELP